MPGSVASGTPCIFIAFLYMFPATMCLPSGEITVTIRHLVFVTVYGWLSGTQDGMEFRPAYQTGKKVQIYSYLVKLARRCKFGKKYLLCNEVLALCTGTHCTLLSLQREGRGWEKTGASKSTASLTYLLSRMYHE